MAQITVYRIQPVDLGIRGYYSENSPRELGAGSRVFLSLEELAQAVRGWIADDTQPELLTIVCDDETDLEDNEDFKGMTLLDGAGDITRRQPFADWAALQDWAANRFLAAPLATYVFDTDDSRANREAAIRYYENNKARQLTVLSDGDGRYAVGTYPGMDRDIAVYMAPAKWEWIQEDPAGF